MSNILVIRSSSTGAASVSNQLVDTYLAALGTNAKVTQHDLDRDPIPHINSQTLAGIGRPAPETEAAKPTRELSDRLIGELQAADVVVLGVPMYNFGMPSTLKSWFDHVLRAGATFQYSEAGPEGLLKGKRAVILAARAGGYSEGPTAALDYQLPHVRTLLGFMGITEVETILAEKLAFGEDIAAESISAAKTAAATAASSLDVFA